MAAARNTLCMNIINKPSNSILNIFMNCKSGYGTELCHLKQSFYIALIRIYLWES